MARVASVRQGFLSQLAVLAARVASNLVKGPLKFWVLVCPLLGQGLQGVYNFNNAQNWRQR